MPSMAAAAAWAMGPGYVFSTHNVVGIVYFHNCLADYIAVICAEMRASSLVETAYLYLFCPRSQAILTSFRSLMSRDIVACVTAIPTSRSFEISSSCVSIGYS